MSRPERRDGHLAIGDYAPIGGGRTGALVGLDGAVDWLCLPDFDGTPILARLLDADRGGRATLAPTEPYATRRAYLAGTNVLETVMTTVSGEVAVVDALTQPGDGAAPMLVRRVEGRAGRVSLAWSVAPRFGHGATAPASVRRAGHGHAFAGDGPAVTVAAWGLGEPTARDDDVRAEVEVAAGDRGLLVLEAASGGAHATRDAAEAALDAAVAGWRRWSDGLDYEGPWRDAVVRSALALKLLAHAPTGAVTAALTTSLPELPGGERNWDYRYCWLRDASFVVDAFGRLGDVDAAAAFLRWLERASDATAPRLQPFYRLDGGTDAPACEVDLAGYRGARPVRHGNGAFDQRQIGTYGDLLQTCSVFAGHGGTLADGLARRLAAGADRVCDVWPREDAGIWETQPYRHHTWSKMACVVALDRAAQLARDGHLPGDGAARWEREAARVREHVERHHWSPERKSYVAVAGDDGLDAAVLLGVFMDYEPAAQERWHATLDRIGEELGAGSLLYRTTALRDQEETFLPCAFWRMHALSRLGRLDEAAQHMDALVGLANDVGIFAEEMAPDGTQWGNVPQALTHGALVNAAGVFAQASRG